MLTAPAATNVPPIHGQVLSAGNQGVPGIFVTARDAASNIETTGWMAAALASELIRFDPATREFTHYPLPTEPAYTRHLAIDPKAGDVWSAYSSLPTAVPKIVRLQRVNPNWRSETGVVGWAK